MKAEYPREYGSVFPVPHGNENYGIDTFSISVSQAPDPQLPGTSTGLEPGCVQNGSLLGTPDLTSDVGNCVDVGRDGGNAAFDQEANHLGVRGSLAYYARLDVMRPTAVDGLFHRLQN